MFKRGAILTTLVHLLVVLSLVIESEQAGGCLGCLMPSPTAKFLAKIATGYLHADQVFELMSSALEKKNMEVGRTNLEELVEMDQMKLEACTGDMAKSRSVAKAARDAYIPNLDRYCADRLDKLLRFCMKQASNKAQAAGDKSTRARGGGAKANANGANTEVVPPIGQDTVDFFRSFLGDIRVAYPPPIVAAYLRGENDGTGAKANIREREAKMKENCKILLKHTDEVDSLKQPRQEDGNDLTVYMREPGWRRALVVCWWHDRNFRTIKFAEWADTKVEHQDQANDADQDREEVANSQAGQPDGSMSQAVADFFSSILRDNASRSITLDQILELHIAYMRNERGEFEDLKKKQAQLRENCKILVHNVDQLKEIDHPTKLDRNELKADMKQPAWWRALLFCKFIFNRRDWSL